MAEENSFKHIWGKEEEEDTLQLADLWGMVRNNWIWYVISIIICLFIAAFYIYRTPKSYSRTAKVIVSESAENSAIRDLASFSGASRVRTGGTNVFNEIQALSSPDLMQRVVERLNYETRYEEK